MRIAGGTSEITLHTKIQHEKQVTTQADANQLGSTGSQTKQTTAPKRKTESGQADACPGKKPKQG